MEKKFWGPQITEICPVWLCGAAYPFFHIPLTDRFFCRFFLNNQDIPKHQQPPLWADDSQLSCNLE
jgi:hypothetical protein